MTVDVENEDLILLINPVGSVDFSYNTMPLNGLAHHFTIGFFLPVKETGRGISMDMNRLMLRWNRHLGSKDETILCKRKYLNPKV